MTIKNLWIIDDDPFASYYIQRLIELQKLAENISVFNYASVALEILKKNDGTEPLPEIILLDIYMPVIDGWQFLEKFSALPSHLQMKL